jgi:membrane protease YdiL (CAAX protease family)
MWFGSDERDDDRREDDLRDRDYQRRFEDRYRDEYWYVSRQPLASLLFVLPLLAAYELGAHYIRSAPEEPVRNGADYWIRSTLQQFGFEQPWFLPVVLMIGLLFWQLAGGYRWRASLGTILGMLCESVVYGLCLVFLGETQSILVDRYNSTYETAPTAAIAVPTTAELTRAVSFLGAGIYEELLFRAALLPLMFGVLRLFFDRGPAIFWSVVGSSLLFSWAHYIGPAGDAYEPFGFAFRAMAGIFFATLMVNRGLGITVGAHAAYDILVGLMLPQSLLQTWLTPGS